MAAPFLLSADLNSEQLCRDLRLTGRAFPVVRKIFTRPLQVPDVSYRHAAAAEELQEDIQAQSRG
jgi:hypothetical protein